MLTPGAARKLHRNLTGPLIALALLAMEMLLVTGQSPAAEVQVNGYVFQIPDGLTLELVAGPPLVDRPITMDVDESGALYVTESSGTNDPVQKQLEERPHRVLKLIDADRDGVYDQRTIFADQMMFPEGSMWLQGSLYVAAPPSIWKLTDTDGDGIADRREEWFQGQTLTGCANDLHGPYRGPDGWIYWCKGAFAEQTYQRGESDPFVTRASHIFRRRPEGGPIEPVMTGGMDNPVDCIFTDAGERVFTTTFFQHPGNGLRDGLIHAIYGGMYGKDHGVLNGHRRTGELLPVLSHMGAAAPCGLVCLESANLGPDYAGRVVAAQFNLHKVSLHQLEPNGAMYQSHDSDLITCHSFDFHPTDVIEAADGSLLVADTGGWYKLCCPSSQLWKPDVLGGIYRLRRINGHLTPDPAGNLIDWQTASPAQLVEFLADSRPMVRRRAADRLTSLGNGAVETVVDVVRSSPSSVARREAIYVLCRINTESARSGVRLGLKDALWTIRQVSGNCSSLLSDNSPEAVAALEVLLTDEHDFNRRIAAEALGRAKSVNSIQSLLRAAEGELDRGLQHALTYALIEIGDQESLAAAIDSPHAQVRATAMIALDQLRSPALDAAVVLRAVTDPDPFLSQSAVWIARQHPEWGSPLATVLQASLSAGELSEIYPALSPLVESSINEPAVQEVIVQSLNSNLVDGRTQALLLSSLATRKPGPLPEGLAFALESHLARSPSAELLSAILQVCRTVPRDELGETFVAAVKSLGQQEDLLPATRLEAFLISHKQGDQLGSVEFTLVLHNLSSDQPEYLRTLAADLLTESSLDSTQMSLLINQLLQVGPLEMERVIAAMARSKADDALMRGLPVLRSCRALASIPVDKLQQAFSSCSPGIQAAVHRLCEDLVQERASQLAQIDHMLETLPPGDLFRGQAIFNSEKMVCKACHAIGYQGGKIGPDLTRIGRIRTERDLLESILFPSASFVRSYEPVSVATAGGQVWQGLLRDEGSEVVITTTERKEVRIPRSEIEEIKASEVSIMPVGLEKLMSAQDLADLVAFLKANQ